MTGFGVAIDKELFRGQRIGLITNHTGTGPGGAPNYEIMVKLGYCIAALFSPEHGLRGEVGEGEMVEDSRDPFLGIPVHSLYGGLRAPEPNMLCGLDVLLFDIQDIGARYYTYASTMLLAMEAAHKVGVRFAVLDRPNPLGGVRVEGNVPSTDGLSFVCAAPVPIRHGLTLGEMARMEAVRRGISEPLVVAMEGWQRSMFYDDLDIGPWIPPSPAATSLSMAQLYPGTCLLEGTNVSEGRGTQAPFRIVGAPFVDGERLASALGQHNLPGVKIRPVKFTPTHWKWAGEPCGGVQFHPRDRLALAPVELGVRLLFALRDLFDQFALKKGTVPPIDRLAGGPELRSSLQEDNNPDELLLQWAKEALGFEETRKPHLLYP